MPFRGVLLLFCLLVCVVFSGCATRDPNAPRVAVPPVVLHNPPPKYSYVAQFFKREGKVSLRLIIDAAGHLKKVRIVKQSGSPVLDVAALDAVVEWRFKPALDQFGKPIESEIVVPFRFQLTQPPAKKP